MILTKEELKVLNNEKVQEEVDCIIEEAKRSANIGSNYCIYVILNNNLCNMVCDYLATNTDLDVSITASGSILLEW